MPWNKAKEMAIENKYYISANDSIVMIGEDDIPWGREIDVSIPTVDSEYYVSNRFNIPACCFEDYLWQVVRYGEIIDSEHNYHASLYIVSYRKSIYLVHTRDDKILVFKRIGNEVI